VLRACDEPDTISPRPGAAHPLWDALESVTLGATRSPTHVTTRNDHPRPGYVRPGTAGDAGAQGSVWLSRPAGPSRVLRPLPLEGVNHPWTGATEPPASTKTPSCSSPSGTPGRPPPDRGGQGRLPSLRRRRLLPEVGAGDRPGRRRVGRHVGGRAPRPQAPRCPRPSRELTLHTQDDGGGTTPRCVRRAARTRAATPHDPIAPPAPRVGAIGASGPSPR
jgi:hypothetical protein